MHDELRTGDVHDRRSRTLLWGAGLALGLGTFLYVLNQPDFIYHPARDLELRATYAAYQESGVLLVKPNGTGSWYGAIEGEGITRAAGDDDPGTYLIALLMSHLTGSASPYPGLRWVMALVAALPMVVLPTFAAALFGRAVAGLSVVLIPLVTMVLNRGMVVPGTDYGLSDEISVAPVYALYAMPGTIVFGALVVLGYALARRLGTRALVALTLLLIVLAALANLLRGMSGVGVALGIGVLWFTHLARSRRRSLSLALAGLVAGAAAVGSVLIPDLTMRVVDRQRVDVVMAEAAQLTDANAPWDNMYLGLAWPQPVKAGTSPFGVPWSDELAWARAAEERPGVRPGTPAFDDVMRDVYFDEVEAAPVAAARLYVQKGLYTATYFAAFLVFVTAGALAVGWAARRGAAGRRRPMFLATVVAVLPTIAIGLLPPVLVMPMIYYFTELVAALGFLSVIALAGIVWAAAEVWSSRGSRREPTGA